MVLNEINQVVWTMCASWTATLHAFEQSHQIVIGNDWSNELYYSTTKETHQSLLGAIMEIRIKK